MISPLVLPTREPLLQHLLDISHLNPNLVQSLFQQALSFWDPLNHRIIPKDLLKGTLVANVFFEPSTRTRSTFEIAAKNLSAEVINLDIQHSSVKKGESLEDTLFTLESMGCTVIVLRHPASGASQFLAQKANSKTHIINAGDGWHAHPTQALLDLFTLQQSKGEVHALSIAIVGDLAHSRVARSQIQALQMLGCTDLRVIAPKTLLPLSIGSWGVQVFHSLEAGLKNVDAILLLRLQKERMDQACVPSLSTYYQQYGLTPERFERAKPDAVILHPGPVNRDVEICSDLLNHPRTLVLKQVTHGILLRMAVLRSLVHGN